VEQVGKSPGIFDEEKLLWMNSHYLKEMPCPELVQALLPYLAQEGIKKPDLVYLVQVAGALRTRVKTLVEMAQAALFFFLDPHPYDPKAAEKFLTPKTAPLLKEVAQALEGMSDLSEASLTLMLQDLVAKTGEKMLNLAQPVRVALTGKTASPSLTEVIAILGKKAVLHRIDNALNFIDKQKPI
jgi:glutamyl-tRNA synthetase